MTAQSTEFSIPEWQKFVYDLAVSKGWHSTPADAAMQKAKEGYEAYAAFTGGKTFDGRDMPTWENLTDRIKQAWAAAAVGMGAVQTAEQKIPQMFMNIVCEVAEAFEEYRNNKKPTEIYLNGNKPEGIPVEIADVVIRAMDTCEALGIDLESAMKRKHTYNASRGFRHGGKRA
jgi:NTP pyrophosphatase (non-canonical NTP hydrolase)